MLKEVEFSGVKDCSKSAKTDMLVFAFIVSRWGAAFRPIAMGWHGVANASQDLSATPGSFCNFYCCFIFVAKESFTEIFVELNLCLCIILENSIFSCIVLKLNKSLRAINI